MVGIYLCQKFIEDAYDLELANRLVLMIPANAWLEGLGVGLIV